MNQYAIYKGAGGGGKFGAIQFSFKPPTFNDQGFIDRSGVVFVNVCSSTAANMYDWNNKIVFALSVDDLGKLLHYFVSGGENSKLSLVHDPNMKSGDAGKTIKSLNFFSSKGTLEGMLLTATQKTGENTFSHKVPISGEEVMVLKALFDWAIPRLLGWDLHV